MSAPERIWAWEQLRQAAIDVVEGRGMFGVDPAQDLAWAVHHLQEALSAFTRAPNDPQAP